MLAIVATLKVNEGKNAEFEAAFAEAMAGVHANEPGNTLYQVVKSRSDPQTYRVMELYADDAALEVHRQSAHFQALGPKLKGLLAGRPEIELHDPI